MAVVDYEKRFREASKHHQHALPLAEKEAIKSRLFHHEDGLFVYSAHDIPKHLCINCAQPAVKEYPQRLTAVNWKLFSARVLLHLIWRPLKLLLSGREDEEVIEEVRFGLCRKHRFAYRKTCFIRSLGCLLVYPTLSVILCITHTPIGAIALFAWPIVCIIAAKRSQVISGYPIDNGLVIKGIGEEFLRRINHRNTSAFQKDHNLGD